MVKSNKTLVLPSQFSIKADQENLQTEKIAKAEELEAKKSIS